MGKSPSHQFGQVIAWVLETSIEPVLRDIARKHNLYLDVKGKRKARHGRKKIVWQDHYGNAHDLDFVLERGGTDDRVGTPVAFIEAAWRRYTKHSRNKAQEIQGAVMPLRATHAECAPFIGVVLAGVYTSGALRQLESLGFELLYFPYDKVVQVFGRFGIDAAFEENTPDSEFARKMKAWSRLEDNQRYALAALLASQERRALRRFYSAWNALLQGTLKPFGCIRFTEGAAT
jgi:hypothetical protein